jgi:pimeloyl-[acyl-carrier protein] methyl ester esterase
MIHARTLGQGRDVVLLHGWALHGGVWDAWATTLARSFRVTVLDLPGHGASGWTADCADLAHSARLLATHAPREAVWVGWSLGGLLALEVARLDPARVSAVYLIAASPCFTRRADWPHAQDDAVLAGFAHDLAQDHVGTLERFLALQTLASRAAQPTLRSLHGVFAEHSPQLAALAAGLDWLRTVDARAQLAALGCPLGVVLGARDRMVPPAVLAALTALQPTLHARLIEDAGHVPFLTHPDACTALLHALCDE